VARSRKARLEQTRDRLQSLDSITRLDPYNPLDLIALGESLLRELERNEPTPLEELTPFEGAGIYALYYLGSQPPYRSLGACNRDYGCRVPIYVGRSKDLGARQGLDPFEPVTSRALFGRVRDHLRSIKAAENLEPDDFAVRVLVVMPIWIPLAEAMAIRTYMPLWNTRLQGFGIHAPGGGRVGQRRSEWDLLHPGRTFAAQLTGAAIRSREELLERIRQAAAEVVARFEARERDRQR
jgi:hypothetical protein